VRARRRNQPVAARFLGTLLHIGAEQAVEHHEHAAVVRIQISQIRRVMHAMRGRRVEHVLEPAELRYPRGVQPELIEQVERERGQHDFGPHAEPDERREEQHGAGESARPAEPECGGERELVRRMVHRVRSPEETDAVRRAVIPVVAELLDEEEQRYRDDAAERQRVNAVMPHDVENGGGER
jgi:hypothetical protein